MNIFGQEKRALVAFSVFCFFFFHLFGRDALADKLCTELVGGDTDFYQVIGNTIFFNYLSGTNDDVDERDVNYWVRYSGSTIDYTFVPGSTTTTDYWSQNLKLVLAHGRFDCTSYDEVIFQDIYIRATPYTGDDTPSDIDTEGNLEIIAKKITIKDNTWISATGSGYPGRLCDDGTGPQSFNEPGGRGGCSGDDSAGGGAHFGIGGKGRDDSGNWELDCGRLSALPPPALVCVDKTPCPLDSPTNEGEPYFHLIWDQEYGTAGGDKGCGDASNDGWNQQPPEGIGGAGGGRLVLAGITSDGLGEVIVESGATISSDGWRGCGGEAIRHVGGTGNDSAGAGAGGSVLIAGDTVTIESGARVSASGGVGGDTRGILPSETAYGGDNYRGQMCYKPMYWTQRSATDNSTCDDCAGGGGGGIVAVLSRSTSVLGPQIDFDVSGGLGGACSGCQAESGGGAGELQLSGGYVGETCDGYDNNFDGSTDEDLGKITCDIGSCDQEIDACVSGKWNYCIDSLDPDCLEPSPDTRPRLTLIMDTSGSMLTNLAGDEYTFGDGSQNHPGIDVNTDGEANDSRLFKAKNALSNVIAAYPEVDWALARFSQDQLDNRSCQIAAWMECADICCTYDNPTNNTGDYKCAANSGTVNINYTSEADTDGEQCINYAGGCGSVGNGADIVAGFGVHINQYLMWMDHKETNFINDNTAGDFCDFSSGGDCELRGTGPTPIGDSLLTAQEYIDSTRMSDPYYIDGQCRTYSIVLLTDGSETCNYDSDYPANVAFDLSDTYNIQTYVIGFSVLPSEQDQLNNIASEGGTTSAYFANDENELAVALASIVANSIIYELCNDEDDDCDGLTDEDFPDKGETCDDGHLGECLDEGVWVCTVDEAGLECNAVDDDNGVGTDEECDGLDNNCNGEIDEDGVCECLSVEDEICDGYDNDCDNLTDETQEEDLAGGNGTDWVDYLDETPGAVNDECSEDPHNGVGICDSGNYICDSDKKKWICEGWGTPLVEIDLGCNDLDDDCDGMTDEGVFTECYDPGATVYSPDSICMPGKMFCDETECQGATVPRLEVCNGLDDSCDGETDEGLTRNTCGECGDGLEYCIGGTYVCCLDGTYNGVDPGTCEDVRTPDPTETCDGLDNNCNSLTDEGLYDYTCGGCIPADYPAFDCVSGEPDLGECDYGRAPCDVSVPGGPAEYGECLYDIGPTTEICDGRDNDCDGLLDEGLGGEDCGICDDGVLACFEGGWKCCLESTYVEGSTCDDTKVAQSEQCNSLDDDCDGETDEFLQRDCQTLEGDDAEVYGVGICHKGIQTCKMSEWGFGEDDESWTKDECGNEQVPANEVCDCLDNDCDGLTDELETDDLNSDWIDYAEENPPAIDDVCGYGDCGHYVCDTDKCDYVCGGHGEPETCNGLDDNCNTLIDEGLFRRCGGCDSEVYPPASHPVEDCTEALDAGTISSPDEGECQRGVSWCDSPDAGVEAWGDCEGSIGPKDELCDNKDNDCDGVTDENEDIDKVGDQCRTAEGICQEGWWRCVDDGNGDKSLECCAEVTPTNECVPPQGPETEECNCLDDDCDSETDEDEDLPIVGESCGWDVGICEAGEYQCSQDICDIECVGESPGTEEECNCLDDDCDGLTDEDLPLGTSCTNSPSGETVGLCDEGNKECINCKWQCNANEPSGEKCNGLDDDCDGLTDENLTVDCPDGSTCVQGECSEPCAGEEMACPGGKTCEWVVDENDVRLKVCVSDVCNESSEEALECVENQFWCDQGHEPPCKCSAAQGKCVGQCDDVACPEGKVCVSKDGTCQIIGDDCWTNGCIEGERCVGGKCEKDPCSDKNCADDKYCNADGRCVKPCEDIDCQAGCYEGECVDDICVGVWCPKGFECNKANGKCVNDDECEDVACRFYEVCKDGECIDDPCWNIKCLNGQRCIDSACYVYENTGPDGDTDTDTDTDTDMDGDSDGDTDRDSDTDTTVTTHDGGFASSDMNRVLVTGMGGCLCTSAPGGRGHDGGIGFAAVLLGLITVMVRFGIRGRKFSVITVFAVALVVFLVGCDIEPYDFGKMNDGTGTSGGDSDSDTDGDTDGDGDGDTDADSDGDSDSDSESGTCQLEGKDNNCDGVDDDCDGKIDEDVNLNTNANHCGKCNNPCQYEHAMGICKDGDCEMGNCAAYWWNDNTSDTDGCEYFCEPKGDQDLCNGVDLGDGLYKGVDDDCDGEIDEDINFETNAINCGRCGNICRFPHAEVGCAKGECTWDKCEEDFWDVDTDTLNGCEYSCTKKSDDETCDNLDDDCDGDVDEDDPGGGGDCYTGETGCSESGGSITCMGICEAGTLQCINGNLQCIGQKTPEVMEECNNLDDDCDGETDENLFQVCQTLTGADAAKYNKGVCARGAQTCRSGVWGAEINGTWIADGCGGEILPRQELCNGADDDCDDLTDGFDTDMAELGVCSHVPGTLPADEGNCEPGTYTCSGGDWVCIGGVAPEAEDCNGEDDNCNGNTDENITQKCGGCDPEVFPDAPTDCDPETQQNEGHCQQGIKQCTGNNQWGDCIATVPPREEECDGFDNDCDGITDENAEDDPLGGEEVCGSCFDGFWYCVDGEIECCKGEYTFGDQCDAPTVASDSDMCNTLNEDCNDDTPDGFGEPNFGDPCDREGAQEDGDECAEGTWICNAGDMECNEIGLGHVEECNGLDDNCNGDTDEGTLPGENDSCDVSCPGNAAYQCIGNGLECMYTCTNAPYGLECMDGSSSDDVLKPIESHCDDYDNNCDGQTDENFDFDNDKEHCGDCNLNCNEDGPQWSLYDPGCELVDSCSKPGNVSDFYCYNGKCYIMICETGFMDNPVAGGLENCDCEFQEEWVDWCNDKDDDCDGLTDEYKLENEICDGVDNDCVNGTDTDDPDLVVPAWVSTLCRDIGECGLGEGAKCMEVDGVTDWWCDYPSTVDLVDSNDPNRIAAQEVRCDGLDNDCDGATDESFPSVVEQHPCSVDEGYGNTGICLSTGHYACDDADPYADPICDIEVAGQAAKPAEECNGLDDNCDGDTDEGEVDTLIHVDQNGFNFYIYKYEASRLDADVSSPGLSTSRACSKSDALPWHGASYQQAVDACVAADGRLCSDAEWTEACKGVPDYIYPYSDDYESTTCNGVDYNGDVDEALPTGTLDDCKSSYEVVDISGNLREWTQENPSPDYYVVRGGSFNTPKIGLTCDFKTSQAKNEVILQAIGFRCCKD
ncbi:MAG: SUMF1/EgtB/PvdO family nonheme iron enzyme [Proteobacteria bacterium]|nr:SUMF1/EgtB/PvdO family nonheme iron enzyme [Pseudomonadota bacterium]